MAAGKKYFKDHTLLLALTIYSLVLVGCFVQSAKQIMEEDAARLAVVIITVACFPDFFLGHLRTL